MHRHPKSFVLLTSVDMYLTGDVFAVQNDLSDQTVKQFPGCILSRSLCAPPSANRPCEWSCGGPWWQSKDMPPSHRPYQPVTPQAWAHEEPVRILRWTEGLRPLPATATILLIAHFSRGSLREAPLVRHLPHRNWTSLIDDTTCVLCPLSTTPS